MKMIGQVVLIAIFLLLVLWSNLHAQTEYKFQYFEAISAKGNVEVVLTEGEDYKVSVKADGIPDDKVSVKTSRGTLSIRLLESIFYKNEEVKVFVTYKDLRKINAFAGAKITSNSTINGDRVEIRSSSGSNVKLNLAVNKVDASASEGGLLKLSGETTSQEASAATGGKLLAFKLESQHTFVKANTGGHAEVVARASLEASANTGGKIDYKGDPEEKSTKSLLSGGVRKI